MKKLNVKRLAALAMTLVKMCIRDRLTARGARASL